jgi:hypothetical protein
MSSRYQFLLSLVAGLLLSTLALADSIPFSTKLLASSNGVYAGVSSPAHVSTGAGSSAPSTFDTFHNQLATSTVGNAPLGASIPGTTTTLYGQHIPDSSTGRFNTFNGPHDTIRFRTKGWSGPKLGGMAAPEPSSLMLLSTGLIGLAGLVRRMRRS